MQQSEAEIRAVFHCIDCDFDTWHGEYYMVTDRVWRQARMKVHGGMLCIGCLQDRIGRKLHRGDFSDYPINYIFSSSVRLAEAKQRMPAGATDDLDQTQGQAPFKQRYAGPLCLSAT